MKPHDTTLLNRFTNGEKRLSVCHITLADGTTVYRFVRSAKGNPTEINGNEYQHKLKKMGGLKESPFSTETNRQSIEISNVDMEWGLMTADALRPLKMAHVETFYYFPLDNTFLYYNDGYLSQPSATEQLVTFTVIPPEEAAGFVFANQTVSARNGFTNPDPDEQTAPSGGDGGGLGGGGVGGGTAPTGCFVRGTPVYEDENNLKFNHNFVKGDAILTFNPETLEIKKGTVTSVINAISDFLLELTFANKKVLRVTKDHKFFTEHRIFTPIAQIPIGTKIYDFAGGKAKIVKLSRVKLLDEQVPVINFECSPFANYLPEGFAVHNRKDEDPPLPGDGGFGVFGGVQV